MKTTRRDQSHPQSSTAAGLRTHTPPRSQPPPHGHSPPAANPLLVSAPTVDDTSDSHERSWDWPAAEYSAHTKPAAGALSWTVHHTLKGAPGIEQLIRQGTAEWAVEASCAATLYTRTVTSTTPVTGVSLAAEDIGAGTVHLWPGIVTVAQCQLDATGTPWGAAPIPLPAGRYLTRGAPLRVSHRHSDPMVFIPDPAIEPETAVSIKVRERGQDCRFEVRARPDRITRLQHDEPALLACWATALALLPAHSVYTIEADEAGHPTVPGSQIGDLILRKLQDEQPDIALWDDPAAWDPMRAASAFVGLPAAPDPDQTQ